MKHRIDDELEKLRQDKEELYKELTLQKNRIEQQYKKQEDELKNRHMMEIRNIEVEALNKARLELSKEDQDLHSENMRLVSDMNLQRGTVENIKKERKRVCKVYTVHENSELKREVELIQSQMEECAAKQNDMTKTIKMLKEKIKILEATLTQVASDHAREKEMLVFELTQRLKDKEEECESKKYADYAAQIKHRTKELKHIRALSQMILDQRSDVEQFFLEALEQIREEVRKRMAQEGKPKKLPSLNSKKPSLNDKVELNDLDWEDRERVLRLLFSKMNMGIAPANWRKENK
jgi:hypothetical protein